MPWKSHILQIWTSKVRYTDVSNQSRCLLHKPYWNMVTLSQDYTHQNSFKSLGLCLPNRYEVDLLNEVLNIDFGQGAAKISEVKVGVQKKYLPNCLVRTHRSRVSRVSRYFFWTPTLTSGIFAAPWPKSIFSTTFERSTSYLFRDQSPKLLNDFNISNLGSK